MRLGMIGLGRMGGNMARRLRRGEIEVVGFNRDLIATRNLADECGLIAADSPEHLISQLERPRLVWLMLPAEVARVIIQDPGIGPVRGWNIGSQKRP